VALVSDAGTPLVSDPGHHLIRTAVDAGIRIEPVPGPSAVMAALAAAAVGGARFTFMGFPPIGSSDRASWFEYIHRLSGPVVFFEAPHRIRPTLEELLTKIGDQPAVLCREMTKAHEELVRGPISAILESGFDTRGEFTVVIDVGQSTDPSPAIPTGDRDLAIEFGEMTKDEGLTKRKAINVLARRHGRPTNEIYKAVERGRKLV
jgi:16S rRNA (cytidine1402-2'-O)-methyltransferase